MTPEAILDLADRFLRKSYDLREVQAELGPVVDASNPINYKAQPRAENVQRLAYGLVDLDGFKPLVSILVEHETPVSMDLSLLVRMLGELKEAPRLKPDEPIPYNVDLRGEDFDGWLTLGLAPGEGPVRDVVSIQLVRYYPED